MNVVFLGNITGAVVEKSAPTMEQMPTVGLRGKATRCYMTTRLAEGPPRVILRLPDTHPRPGMAVTGGAVSSEPLQAGAIEAIEAKLYAPKEEEEDYCELCGHKRKAEEDDRETKRPRSLHVGDATRTK